MSARDSAGSTCRARWAQALPVMDTATLGRTIASNTAMQAHVAKYFWPEVEINSTFFKGGANDGKNMTFATPGLLFTHKLRPAEKKSRLATVRGSRRTNRHQPLPQLQPRDCHYDALIVLVFQGLVGKVINSVRGPEQTAVAAYCVVKVMRNRLRRISPLSGGLWIGPSFRPTLTCRDRDLVSLQFPTSSDPSKAPEYADTLINSWHGVFSPSISEHSSSSGPRNAFRFSRI